MTYFSNFDFPCPAMGLIFNVEVEADEDKLKRITLFDAQTGRLIKQDNIPVNIFEKILDESHYQIDMQVMEREKKHISFSNELFELGASMNREIASSINKDNGR